MVTFGSLRLATEPAAAKPQHRTLAEGDGRLGLGLGVLSLRTSAADPRPSAASASRAFLAKALL